MIENPYIRIVKNNKNKNRNLIMDIFLWFFILENN